VAIDFEAEGLLDGLEGDALEARRELLAELAADGVPLDELRRAVDEDRLALLPVERFYEREGTRYTIAEVADQAGLDVGFLVRQRQALGLPAPDPDEVEYTDADLEAARRSKLIRDTGVSEEAMLEFARVLGLAMSQVATTNLRMIADGLLQPGDTELQAATRFAQAARDLTPEAAPMLGYTFNLHLRQQMRQDAISRTMLAEGRLADGREVAVSFADMVGFTKLGELIGVEELGAVTGRLGELASAVSSSPVRLVKMIGDAAMLVSPEPRPLLDAALALVEAADEEGEGFPLLRAGVATGEALTRGGDWFGRPVNLASRITAVAYPSSVLCAADVRKAAGEGYRWSPAGRRKLKGIGGAVELARVRRAEP
jgi:adenylate cyclase